MYTQIGHTIPLGDSPLSSLPLVVEVVTKSTATHAYFSTHPEAWERILEAVRKALREAD